MYSSHLLSSVGSAAIPTFGPPAEPLTLDIVFAGQPANKFAAGEGVFWEGDKSADIFQIIEGCLRLYRILPDGRRAIMGFRFAGETLGLSCEGTYCYTAEAVTSVRLRRLSRARLRAMGEEVRQLQPLLLAKIFEEIRAARQHIIVLGQLGAEERTAHFLVSAARRTGADQRRPVTIELPMTRQDIADYLGLTIETVCRVLSKLKRDGLVALEGRHKIILMRMTDLQHLAGEFDDADPHAPTYIQAKWPQ
ncbi:helix-turn-helix domain-containing protein [Microvirga lotononidis]|uniref:cAMP-binding protein n=1 Tax=Microvirga lotononidis TaxID=864069 RepID=I4YXY0_9HYPH|nr:helix-turn-helix domain-containing protein [Microvirga lotononidis]EIM28822.1 cAMP-binding protein [Microvirga lotononidis]WQO25450.1 helix-turn-helix domain-containing protein [Microvirga lotononidis]